MTCMRELTIYRIDILKRVALCGVVGLAVLIFLSVRRHYEYLNYKFNGRVDNISYGDKGTPIIIINGNTYFLEESDWNLHDSHMIQKGDSMIKNKNSTLLN